MFSIVSVWSATFLATLIQVTFLSFSHCIGTTETNPSEFEYHCIHIHSPLIWRILQQHSAFQRQQPRRQTHSRKPPQLHAAPVSSLGALCGGMIPGELAGALLRRRKAAAAVPGADTAGRALRGRAAPPLPPERREHRGGSGPTLSERAPQPCALQSQRDRTAPKEILLSSIILGFALE